MGTHAKMSSSSSSSSINSFAKLANKNFHNNKLRSALFLFVLLFLSTWTYQHSSVGRHHLNRRSTPKDLTRGRGAVVGAGAATSENGTSAGGDGAVEVEGPISADHTTISSDSSERLNLTQTYEDLLDAVQQLGNESSVYYHADKVLTNFHKIEEECRRAHTSLDLTGHLVGLTGVGIFLVSYATVVCEEQLSKFAKYHKSVPMTVAAGLIWILIAFEYKIKAPWMLEEVESAFRTSFLEFGETFLFLVVAMTYVNAMEAMGVFKCVQSFLVEKRFTLKQLFWVTGVLSFVLSPLADNLTTALLMGAVIRSVGSADETFMTLSLVNIVVASNAGGAFSPFGDITTLMIWQKGKLGMADFPHIVVPSLVNWLIPAYLIQKNLPEGRPSTSNERSRLSLNAFLVVLLFFFTVAMTALLHAWLKLPAVLGMMTGLGLLQLFGYGLEVSRGRAQKGSRGGKQWLLKQSRDRVVVSVGADDDGGEGDAEEGGGGHSAGHQQDQLLFSLLSKIDWDTLLFFYGVIVAVGGLGVMGYLSAIAEFGFNELGAKPANILIGGLSALIDNIPVLYAVLVANPVMPRADWMLVTLTSGCGGSILSFGSAAGVGLMGQEPKHYNFHRHLQWSWAIIIGYVASILVHFALNGF